MLLDFPSVAFYRFLLLTLGGDKVLDVFKKLPAAYNYRYVAIIDAGSSGTRIHAFKFRVPKSLFGAEMVDLVEDIYIPTNPGLSYYANDPAKGAQTVVNLIKKIGAFVPKKERHKTPIILRATAGLRILPNEQANSLLVHTRKAIANLGYKTNEDSVHIMDGSDEGIFNWYAINLLSRHSIAGANLTFDETLVALDLGGASTQVTYKEVTNKACHNRTDYDHFCVHAGGNNMTLYSHSYLNLGMKQALLGLFRLEMDKPIHNLTNFVSVCVHPSIQNRPLRPKKKKNEELLFVSGAKHTGLSLEQRYDSCYTLMKKRVFSELDVPPPKLGDKKRIAAVSNFFEVPAKYGLIDDKKGVDVLNIAKLREEAKASCLESNVTKVDQFPWKCLDLVYLATLLHDVYGIPDNKSVYLEEIISKIFVSWPIGLAYVTIMDDILKRKPDCHQKQEAYRLMKGHSTCVHYL